jgi:hypothetical protein
MQHVEILDDLGLGAIRRGAGEPGGMGRAVDLGQCVLGSED